MMENEHGRIDFLTKEQVDWCNEHNAFTWIVNDKGMVRSIGGKITFNNKDSIVSFPVWFADCSIFSCSMCKNLLSLRGAPRSVGSFDCSSCDSLLTLEGASSCVEHYFACVECDSLRSFDGFPDVIHGNFYSYNCKRLKTLDGIRGSVGGYVDISNCKSLESIDGFRNVRIKGVVKHSSNCPKLKKYSTILDDRRVWDTWLKSGLTADEFLKKYDGFIDGCGYGI